MKREKFSDAEDHTRPSSVGTSGVVNSAVLWRHRKEGLGSAEKRFLCNYREREEYRKEEEEDESKEQV